MLLHERSISKLDAVVSQIPHAVIISGDNGIGLRLAADYIAEQLSVSPHIVLPEKDGKIDRDKGTLSVATIRRLYDDTKSISKTMTIIAIDDAERMTREAQNAFLKLLEEPRQNLMFVILTHTPEALLPTIRSRSQQVDLLPMSDNASRALLDELGVDDPSVRAQLLFIASGLPEALRLYAEDAELFATRSETIRDARALLSGTFYEKLQIVQRYTSSRQRAEQLVRDASRLAGSNIKQTDDERTRAVLLRLLDAYEMALQRLLRNGNVRLALLAAVSE